MAYFEFPHTRNYEGDLGWIIKNLTETAEIVKYLQEEFAKIVVLTADQIQTMIDKAIANNNLVIAQQLIDLKTELTAEYKAYCNAQIASLKIYVDNQDVYYHNLATAYSDHNLIVAEDYTDNKVMSYTMMINPITGVYEDVRNVVEDIVDYFHTENALTAAEYDALDLTAAAYEAYDLTAYDYDFNGKIRLV